MTAFLTTARNSLASVFSRHTFSKTVFVLALPVTWLVRAFHEFGYFLRSISYPKKALNISRISEKSELLFHLKSCPLKECFVSESLEVWIAEN